MNLRDYQIDVIEKARILIRSGHKSFLLHLPTGAGKTQCAAEIVRSAVSKSRRVLFLAHRRELIEQASRKLSDFNIPHGIILQNHPLTDLSKPVQVASIQTLVRRDQWPADIIIVDECHLAQADSYKKILDSYPLAIKIGLTATPSRLDGKPLSGIFKEIVSGPSITELIDTGYLVPIRHFAPSAPDLSGVEIERGDYASAGLDMAVSGSQLVGDIVATWKKLAQGRRTVAFCVGIRHAEIIKMAFNDAGIPAGIIHGSLSIEERARVLSALESGEILVLSSVGVLNEGWDMPVVSCGILARPTLSPGLYLQQAGRVLRPFPGKKDCLARGTKILTDDGEVEIQDVTIRHKVWDGQNFVSHEGAVCRGTQRVMEYDGIIATPDHEVMTNDGFKTLEEVERKQGRITRSGVSGMPIRISYNRVSDHAREQLPTPSRSPVRPLWEKAYGALLQHQETSRYEGLSALQWSQVCDSPEMDLSPMPKAAITLQQSESWGIRAIWWARDKIFVRRSECRRNMDCPESWDSRSVTGYRSDKQQWALRAGKLALGSQGYPSEQHTAFKWITAKSIHLVQEILSRYSICRLNVEQIDDNVERYGNYRAMENPLAQTEREVWDILNSGPLHRFTANNRLVSNCLLLDHAGLALMHGLVTEEREWAFHGKKKKKGDARETALTWRCENCFFTNSLRVDVCGECETPRVRQIRDIRHEEGELSEIDPEEFRAQKKQLIRTARTYPEFQAVAKQLGYRPGWAWHQYQYKKERGII